MGDECVPIEMEWKLLLPADLTLRMPVGLTSVFFFEISQYIATPESIKSRRNLRSGWKRFEIPSAEVDRREMTRGPYQERRIMLK